MSEHELLFIDIKEKSKSSTALEGGVKKPLWTQSDNSFRFDFLSDSFSTPQEKASTSDLAQAATSQILFTGQKSAFAFNFQLPVATPEEDMDTTGTTDSSSHNQQCVQEEKPSLAPPKASQQTKTKKKKSGKKKLSDSETQQKPAECSQGEEDLSAEEQLNRQLDWCIEQLELGLKTQKGTPKQKEEASRALKTLRSSKAPLAKKRQVMRVMTGDYREKMEDEKSKQFKLIQSEIASAQVKVVSNSPRQSLFHRRAEVKTQPPATEGDLPKTQAQDKTKAELPAQEPSSEFVFVPSKEEFCFNFF